MIVFAVITALLGVLAALRIAGPMARAAETAGARLGAFGVAAIVALGALGAYAVGGEPDQPGRPWSAVVTELEAAGLDGLGPEPQLALLREQVRRDPNDADALLQLGRVLSSAGRELEGVALIERAARQRPDARSFADLGQALVALNEGEVTPEARRAFTEALSQAPDTPEAGFYMGLAAWQDGDRTLAATRWAETIALRPDGDPHRLLIARQAADLLSRPQAGPVDAAAAAEAAPVDQEGGWETMAQGMAERLETRLTADEAGGDFSGWLTLARARALLDENGSAAIALGRARSQLEPGDARALIVDELARALGLEEGET